MRRVALLLPALLCLLALPASAQELKALEKQLKTAYKDKVLAIRGFYKGNSLRYDAEGKLLEGGKPGPWTLTGKIQVLDIKLKRDKLELWGKRLWLAYDEKKKEFRHLGTSDKVRIELQLEKDKGDEASIVRAFNQIFLWNEQQLAEAVPDYWRSFLSKDEPPPVQPGEPVPFPPGGLGPVYRVGGKVSAPVCISCPDPKYSNEARAAKFTALIIVWAVIDEQGRVRNVRIQTPAGLGLDDAAVEAVKRWTFKPATRFGKSVPVAIAIEIHFNLF